MSIPLLSGFAPLASRYDAAILDLWGVVHNGKAVFPDAADCMGRMRAAGIKLALLSNAPRQSSRVVEQLRDFGVKRSSYDAIVTSGDLTLEALAAEATRGTFRFGRTFYHLGPSRDDGLLDDLPYREVPAIEDADFILNTGLFDDNVETAADYDVRLRAAAALRQPIVCVNPDLTVMLGEAELPCAGALAQAYEAVGGETAYFGKPHQVAYDACFKRLGVKDTSRVIVFGDSLHTDISGAARAGLDAIFVASGIHAAELGVASGGAPDAGRIARFFEGRDLQVVGVMGGLSW
jgi:HAD superfamily hydrolase (TIGR01459 family)